MKRDKAEKHFDNESLWDNLQLDLSRCYSVEFHIIICYEIYRACRNEMQINPPVALISKLNRV